MINYYNIKYLEKFAYKYLRNLEKIVYKERNKKEYLCISMFPYPSGMLHLGHFRNYIINDLICRIKLIKGYKSFMFFGWDSFGLPAEKKSIEKNLNPIVWVKKNILLMKNQINKMCLIINWKKELNTSSIDYYYYNQLLFKNLFKYKYIYIRKNWVNWDSVDKTVLAEEQVINGRGWRSNSLIKKKLMPMYYFSVKKILHSLIKNKEKYSPKSVLKLQKKWISKKYYYFFYFYFKKKKIKFFVKNIKDLFFGNSLLVSYENFYFISLLKKKEEIKNFVNSDKKFYDTKIYGTFYFFKKIKYKIIITKDYYDKNIILKKIVKFNPNKFLIKIFLKIFLKKIYLKKFFFFFKKNIFCKKKYISKLKDWSLSRQRYWGTPIPVLKCKCCGFIISKIPVKIKNFNKKIEYNTFFNYKNIKKCYICKKKSIQENETLDTFFDSSWYFIKYFLDEPFKKFMFLNKIDKYIGGIEHSILHLLYVKYIFIFLKKIKMCNIINPFNKILVQGLVLNKSYYSKKYKKYVNFRKLNSKEKYIIKTEKMSKSKKNGINPINLISRYGVDCLRMFIFFSCNIKDNLIFDEKKIKGIQRFIKKVWNFLIKLNFKNFDISKKDFLEIEEKILLKKIVNNIIYNYKKLKINIVISYLMILFKELKSKEE
ncbi:class I tRNA ligase family protein [Candidatus Vidania fulgoroideorum]